MTSFLEFFEDYHDYLTRNWVFMILVFPIQVFNMHILPLFMVKMSLLFHIQATTAEKITLIWLSAGLKKVLCFLFKDL